MLSLICCESSQAASVSSERGQLPGRIRFTVCGGGDRLSNNEGNVVVVVPRQLQAPQPLCPKTRRQPSHDRPTWPLPVRASSRPTPIASQGTGTEVIDWNKSDGRRTVREYLDALELNNPASGGGRESPDPATAPKNISLTDPAARGSPSSAPGL